MFSSIPVQEGYLLYMQQEKIKKIICWALVAVCMAVIFYFSSRTASESSQQSNGILLFLKKLLENCAFTDHLVRKGAHFLEFTGLSFLFSLALLEQTKKLCPLRAVIFTSAYAATDEFHQIFVDGRSCQFSDWCIDTAGAVLGMAVFVLIYFILGKIISDKKAKSIDRNRN